MQTKQRRLIRCLLYGYKCFDAWTASSSTKNRGHNLHEYARLLMQIIFQFNQFEKLERKWSYLTKWLMLKLNFDVLAENVCLLVQWQKTSWWIRKEWQIEIALFGLFNLFFQNKQLFDSRWQIFIVRSWKALEMIQTTSSVLGRKCSTHNLYFYHTNCWIHYRKIILFKPNSCLAWTTSELLLGSLPGSQFTPEKDI